MRNPGGYNPMRWDCKSGENCFNAKCRPKVEVFFDCFPGYISFGDIDGIVEIGGLFCLLEWKGKNGRLRTAQEIMFSQFTEVPGNIAFIVEGDAETMTVNRYSVFLNGKMCERHADKDVDLLQLLKCRIKKWSREAVAIRNLTRGVKK